MRAELSITHNVKRQEENQLNDIPGKLYWVKNYGIDGYGVAKGILVMKGISSCKSCLLMVVFFLLFFILLLKINFND